MRLIGGLFKLIGGTIKWVMIVAVFLVIVVVIISVVALGKGVSNANKQAAHVAPLMGKVTIGTSEAQTRRILGAPDSTDSSTIAGLGTEVDWYYGTLSTKGTWQLVFQDGRLEAKNRYS